MLHSRGCICCLPVQRTELDFQVFHELLPIDGFDPPGSDLARLASDPGQV